MPYLPVRVLIAFLLLVLCASLPSAAQKPLLRHFTTKDGLPSNVIYEIFHDRMGFIWFCTDQGISRYDGSRFRNYTINDGLPDSEVFGMYEDTLQRLWLICYNGHACYFSRGKIRNSTNDPLCRLIETAQLTFPPFFTDATGAIFVMGRCVYPQTGRPRSPRLPVHSSVFSVFYHTLYEGDEYLLNHGKAYVTNRGGYSREQAIAPLSTLAASGRGNRICQVGASGGQDSLYTYTISKRSVHLDHQIAVPTFCYAVRFESDTSILCLTEKGIYEYNEYQGSFRKSGRFPGGIVFNRMLHDREGNIWLSTLTNGVYMQTEQPVLAYHIGNGLPDNDVLSICPQAPDTIIACYNNGGFSLVEKARVRNLRQPLAGGNGRVKFAYRLEDGRFLAGGDRGLFVAATDLSTNTRISREPCKDCFRLGHRYFIAHGDGISCYDDSLHQVRRLWQKRTTAIASRDGETIWFGTLNGLYCLQSGLVRKVNLDSTLSGSRIVGLACAGSRYLAVATDRNGLYCLDGQSLAHIDRRAGLASDQCTALCADSNGTVWVATDKGLDRVRFPFGAANIYHYSVIDGLPDFKINNLAAQKDKLYVATTDGIIVLDKAQLHASPYASPEVYVLSVEFGDSLIDWPARKLMLPSDRNSLRVNYAGVFLTAGSGLQYRYVLEGGGTDSVYTRQSTISLSSLRPGDYRLLIWAKHDAALKWTDNPAVFAFTIRPPFWRTGWFAALSAALLALAVYGMYAAKVRAIRRKEAEAAMQQQQTAVLKMQALRSQINPHFLFNALNSIQHFYSQHEEQKANHYMGLFTQLIRKALDYSEKHWLILAREVEVLSAYLELEQMRFRNAFVYRIDLDPAIDANTTLIPSMLLQPYIENAVRHGLRGLKERPGMLTVSFGLEEGLLRCTVDDNGIGIRKGLAGQQTHRPSFGMSLTLQRIETLNSLYQSGIRVVIQDKSEHHPPEQGTLIVLYTPVRKYYE